MISALIPSPAVAAQRLSADETRLVRYLEPRSDEMVALLERTVRIDSRTENLDGVRRVGAVLRGEFDALGFTTRWIDMPPEMQRAGHLFAERTGTRGKRLLLIGHLDTVLPGGTYRREGSTLFGSGVGDMKGGNIILLYALKALHSIGALDNARIIVAFTGDEEAVGAPLEIARRDLIAAARRSDVALAFETAVGDTATVARRGFAAWQLEVQGATGHSSGIFSPAAGAGAALEAARILTAFYQELRAEDGVTFNPALVLGGTEADVAGTSGSASGKFNVIAQRVIVQGDLRFASAAQLTRLKGRIETILAQHLPRTSATIRYLEETPAMEAAPGNFALLEQLDQVSRDLGYGRVTALDPKLRGYGDISFVAHLVPSLDGLGARCEGAHTPRESSDITSLQELVQRTAVLLYRLTR